MGRREPACFFFPGGEHEHEAASQVQGAAIHQQMMPTLQLDRRVRIVHHLHGNLRVSEVAEGTDAIGAIQEHVAHCIERRHDRWVAQSLLASQSFDQAHGARLFGMLVEEHAVGRHESQRRDVACERHHASGEMSASACNSARVSSGARSSCLFAAR